MVSALHSVSVQLFCDAGCFYLFTDVIFILLQKITVAECIETQSKAMTMLTIDQLSYLLKFALQKIKQPGVRAVNTWHSSSVGLILKYPITQQSLEHGSNIHFASSTFLSFIEQTEPFQKPVSLEQHPDYAEYIFHPMDLCTLEKVTLNGQNKLLNLPNP